MASVFLGRSMARWPAVLLAGAFTIGIAACGHGDTAANQASMSRDDTAPRNATARVATQRLNPDPCAIVPRTQVEQLIGPLMAEPDDWPAPSARQNACALLTRADAEAVLGPLVVAPYASQGGSALASTKGWSCAYYTHGHRALVLSPTWSNGKIDFKMASGMEKMIARAAGSGASAATTLDGPWDQVSKGMDGALHILAGDRILVVNYLSSSTDLSGAVKLARIAVGRLKSVPAQP